MYDVIIVGGGPAGLSAALILGRCRRKVLVCDSGTYRNRWSKAMHGFLSRDGIAPAELLQIGREQLEPYKTVEIHFGTVEAACSTDDGFEVTLPAGRTERCRKLLLATGVIDRLPEIPGLIDLYGRSVFHCPYCDGWERRDQPIAVIGGGKSGRGLSLTLTVWSSDLVLCTNGPAELSRGEVDDLDRRGIRIRQEKIERIEGEGGTLKGIVFAGGDFLPRKAIFLHTFQVQGSPLPEFLGCEDPSKRSVPTGDYESTDVPGLYVAGDASRDTQLAIVAAAEGANAAFAINKELLKEDLQRTAARS